MAPIEQKYILYYQNIMDDGDGYTDIMDEYAIGPFDSLEDANAYNHKELNSQYKAVPFDSSKEK